MAAVTVVTAFYEIPSKFTFAKYLEWAVLFLQMSAPVVIFTDETLALLLQALRPPEKPIHIIIRPFQELESWKMYESQWILEHNKDREKAHHSPQLYSLWAQKAWFVKEVVEKNPFGTEFFFWCDIGAFRNDPPHPLFPTHNFLPRDRILLNSVQPLTAEERTVGPSHDFSHVDRIVGGLWGGGAQGCLRWHAAFANVLESYFRQGRFAGKDQSVMISTYLANPSLAHVVRCTRPEKDHWFFLEELLAGQAHYTLDTSYSLPQELPIVSVSIKGGLGNQMFQIATAYAFAKKVGGRLQLLREKPVPDSRPQKYWESVLAHWSSYLTDTLPTLPVLHERGPTQYSSLPQTVSLPGAYLEGYWQSSRYFQGVEQEIREAMILTPQIRTDVQAKYGWILAANERIVLVHARRTDYLKAAAFHGPLTAEYYKRATEYMLEIVPNPIFLLVSDDTTFWSDIAPQVPALQTHETITLQSANDVQTLGLMQQLRYFILANSTFSWWGAWLAGPTATVLVPTKWFGPTGPKPYEYEDIYEQNWIRL